jgi:hypothetical protein
VPPTYGSLLRLGDNFTYLAHRTLLPGESLVREYSRTEFTSLSAVGTIDPALSKRAEVAETYRRWLTSSFGEWRLSVTGTVARPETWSLAELKRLPSRTQIPKSRRWRRSRLREERLGLVQRDLNASCGPPAPNARGFRETTHLFFVEVRTASSVAPC